MLLQSEKFAVSMSIICSASGTSDRLECVPPAAPARPANPRAPLLSENASRRDRATCEPKQISTCAKEMFFHLRISSKDVLRGSHSAKLCQQKRVENATGSTSVSIYLARIKSEERSPSPSSASSFKNLWNARASN